MNRASLPYRKNCEGYFLYGNKNIIARDTRKGFIEFPGGGIEINEKPEEALLREAHEETGIVIEGNLKKVSVLKFIWGENWAKTEKQKKRFKEFKGEEMYFFVGKVNLLTEPKGDPENNFEKWGGNIVMPIKKVIDFIEKSKPFSKDIKEYRQMQLSILKEIYKSKYF